MAHDLAAFRERFPAFDDYEDGEVQIALDDAALMVDDTWIEAHVDPAILNLAAHYLAAGATATEQVEDGGPPIKSETIGRISTTYGDPASSEKWTTTEYGSRFNEFFIMNRNHGALI